MFPVPATADTIRARGRGVSGRGPQSPYCIRARGRENKVWRGGAAPMKRSVCMQCRMVDLRCKEVINICDGCRLGYVGDVEVTVPEGKVVALIVPGPPRFFGLFGRGEEYYVPWDCIKQIGDDIVLVDKPFQRREPYQERRRRHRS